MAAADQVECLESSIVGCGVPAAGNHSCPGLDIKWDPAAAHGPAQIQPIERAPMITAWEQAFVDCPGLP